MQNLLTSILAEDGFSALIVVYTTFTLGSVIGPPVCDMLGPRLAMVVGASGYVCIFICMYIYMYTYTYVYVCIYIYIYIYMCVCVLMCLYISIGTQSCISAPH